MDIAKGCAIILMVLGHTSMPDIPSRFIWSFHMPLFFIASGWMTNWGKYSFGEFVIKRTKSILIPFVIYSAIVLLFYEFLIEGGKISNWITEGWKGYALWFVPVLFFASILSMLINIVMRKYTRYGMMIVLLITGSLLSYHHLLLPWSLSSVPFACFWVLLGIELKKIQEWIDKPRWWIFAGGFILSLGVSFFWRLDMCFNRISPIIPLVIGAISGTLMMFTFSSYVANYTYKCSQFLQSVGRNTYVVVAFSQISIMLLNKYFSLNVFIKYGLLVFILMLICLLKDAINRKLGFIALVL